MILQEPCALFNFFRCPLWKRYTFCDRAPPQSVCEFRVCLARVARKEEKKQKAYRETGRLGPHCSVETDDAGLVHQTGRDELVIHIRLPRHVFCSVPAEVSSRHVEQRVFKMFSLLELKQKAV